jgi:hypothetical protein
MEDAAKEETSHCSMERATRRKRAATDNAFRDEAEGHHPPAAKRTRKVDPDFVPLVSIPRQQPTYNSAVDDWTDSERTARHLIVHLIKYHTEGSGSIPPLVSDDMVFTCVNYWTKTADSSGATVGSHTGIVCFDTLY